MNDIEQRLSELMARKAAAADVRPEPDFLQTRAGVRSAQARRARWTTPRLVAIAAAAVVLVVGVVLTITVGRDAPDAVDGGPGGGITVHYERVEVTLAAQLECDQPIDTTGTFTTMVIESYADRSGRRFRNTVTYPDGSTRDLIALGSAIYPTTLADRGEWRGSTFGCLSPDGEQYTLIGEPGQGNYTSLNRLDDLSVDEVPYMLDFHETGERVEGKRVDSLGRPARLWRQHIEGTAGFDRQTQHPVSQDTEWWVATTGSKVLETRYTDVEDTIGTATLTQTLTDDGMITVAGDFFDTTGYRMLEPLQRPELPPPGSDDEGQGRLYVGLGELGVDVIHAPKAVLALGDALFCGWDHVTDGEPVPNTEAQQCLLAAHAAGRAAVYVEGATTKEGDPLVLVYRTEGGKATMYADSTRDRFGSGQWDTVVCDDVIATEAPALLCLN